MNDVVILGAAMIFGAAALFSSAALEPPSVCQKQIELVTVFAPTQPLKPPRKEVDLSWPVEERLERVVAAEDQPSTPVAAEEEEPQSPRRHRRHWRRRHWWSAR